MILHCTAGKDRTGFAAALLLTLLGVPRETIVEDYLLTNSSVDLRARLVADESGLGIPQGRRYMVELPAEALDAVLAADADYLLGALDAAEASHGSIDAYLRDAAGVSDDMRCVLERALVEAA
jgi:protein-tyrosine phosphatase